jgi:O-antigen/teichoic acid export membrane protein
MRTFAVFQTLRAVLLIAALLGLTLLRWPGERLAFIFPVGELVLFVGLLWACREELIFKAWRSMLEWMKKHLAFGLRGMVGQVLGDVNYRIDILMLGFFFDDHTVGIFSLASVLAEGLYQLPAVLRTNFNPVLVRLLSENRAEELKALIRRGRKLAYIGMTVIGVAAMALYPLGLYLVRNRGDYLQSWPVFAVLMVGIIAASGYIPFGFLLLQAGRPGLQTVMIALLITVNVLLNLVLAPWLGVMGVALSTAISYGLSVLLLKGFLNRFLGLKI